MSIIKHKNERYLLSCNVLSFFNSHVQNYEWCKGVEGTAYEEVIAGTTNSNGKIYSIAYFQEFVKFNYFYLSPQRDLETSCHKLSDSIVYFGQFFYIF